MVPHPDTMAARSAADLTVDRRICPPLVTADARAPRAAAAADEALGESVAAPLRRAAAALVAGTGARVGSEDVGDHSRKRSTNMTTSPADELESLKSSVRVLLYRWEHAEKVMRCVSHDTANVMTQMSDELRKVLADPPPPEEEPLPF
jgi:hypothetical protein